MYIAGEHSRTRQGATRSRSLSRVSVLTHMRMSRPGEPLQLIAVDPISHQVHLTPEAAACLRSIRTPVGVIAVCGRARTGKSYILNQLLGSCTGFRVAHSHKPCTKGLWIWSQPFKQIGPDGVPYHLVRELLAPPGRHPVGTCSMTGSLLAGPVGLGGH